MQSSSLTCLFFIASGFCTLVTQDPVLAQTGQKESKTATAQDAGAKKTTKEWRALEKATDETRPKALVDFVEYHIASNAIFEGQYTALKSLEPTHALVQKWIMNPPAKVTSAPGFRLACIRAVRDIYSDEASDELKADLLKIVQKSSENRGLRENAVFALAQFGDRRHADNMIKNFTGMTEKTSAAQQANGYSGLANVHYQIRDYKKAVAAHKAFLRLVESRSVRVPRGPQIYFYNAACTMALARMTDDAFTYLKKALKSGKDLSRRMLMEDMDMVSLRKDPRFAKLIAEYFDKSKAAKKDREESSGKKGGSGK